MPSLKNTFVNGIAESSVFEPLTTKSRPIYPQETFYVDQPTAPGAYLGPIDASLPGSEKVPLLFQPFTVKDLTIANRVIVAPMCMYSSKDGFFTNFHLASIGSFAINGAGLIIQEATAVQANGRITPGCAGLWDDAQVYKLKEIVDFVHAQGSKIGIQLAHAGRKASTKAPYTNHSEPEFWRDNVVAPSGGAHLQWDHNHVVPRELSIEEIQETIDAFGAAAARAAHASMDTVEIHGAHGYLMHNFLSPLTNHRTDKYGGSLENRARLMMEVIQTVRANFPAEKPIFLRISASDCVEHLEGLLSWEIEQTVQIARWVRDAGVDVLHVTSGGNTAQQKINAVPGYQVPFAERIKKEVPGLAVVTVGMVVDGKQAEEILEEEKADLVAVARGVLNQPNFVLNVAKSLNVKAAFSQQYGRGRTLG
ncbi:NADH:flavin oxidoreductase/NADH oxidase [Dissophora ornata]|nr:NADH:flavin oxidoreductase/NADH oxidase [Dissophora ornata]